MKFDGIKVGDPVWDVHGNMFHVESLYFAEGFLLDGKYQGHDMLIDLNGVCVYPGYDRFGCQFYPYPVKVVDNRSCESCGNTACAFCWDLSSPNKDHLTYDDCEVDSYWQQRGDDAETP